VTALIGIPLVLAAVFYARPWPLAAVLLLTAVLAIGELSRLFPSGRRFDAGRLAAATLATTAGALVALREELWGFSGALFVLGIFCSFRLAQRRGPAVFGAACFWVLIPLASMFRLWQMGLGEGAEWWNLQSFALMVLLPLWAGDSAGIFVGQKFGKRLLAPGISPKKTWAGAVANALACLALALAVGRAVGLSISTSAVCGGVCAVFGQAGDLFESRLKRLADVKDSGSLLPGHGGILDRIDSIFFSAPVVAMVLGFWR